MITWSQFDDATEGPEPIVAVVKHADLLIHVIAGGELESARTVEIRSQVEGFQPKIIELVPQGTCVKAGDVVARLDPSEIKRAIVEQEVKVMQTEAKAKAAAEELEIQKGLSESAIAQAELAQKLAELDKKKYQEGEYKVQVDDLRGSIALSEADLQDAQETVEHYQRLVKKGFRTPEQLRIKEQAVERFEYYLERDKEKLRLLEEFTRDRTLVELTSKAEQSVREVDRAKRSGAAAVTKAQADYDGARATAQLERLQLEKLATLLEHCSVRAPEDGVLIYASSKSQPIDLGSAVHYQQQLFSLPDLSRLQVEAFVHESQVKMVAPGMAAEMRVDALGDRVLTGAVEDIATIFDPVRQWMLGGVKEYATTVSIEKLPRGVALKPGMTAEVKILVQECAGALVVPVTAALEEKGRYYCYVEVPGLVSTGIERREISIGQSNSSLVEIHEGLKEGDRVIVNARGQEALERKPVEKKKGFFEKLSRILGSLFGGR